MKRNKLHIIYTWALLICFVAGQYMVFAHTHYKHGVIVSTTKHGLTVLKEKCDSCDAMHHTNMLISQHVYFTPVTVVLCQYQDKIYDVIRIQLVLASGRAPPMA